MLAFQDKMFCSKNLRTFVAVSVYVRQDQYVQLYFIGPINSTVLIKINHSFIFYERNNIGISNATLISLALDHMHPFAWKLFLNDSCYYQQCTKENITIYSMFRNFSLVGVVLVLVHEGRRVISSYHMHIYRI